MGDAKPPEDEIEFDTKKPIMFLGRDLRKITCFRDSFICGICTGFLAGLGCFMFTSKARFSTHFGFGSLWVGVWGYWLPCRYKYETNALKVEQWKKMMNTKGKETE